MKALFFLFLLAVSGWAGVVEANDQRFCVTCQREGTYHCLVESTLDIGPKPGRFLCATYLSEAFQDKCKAGTFSLYGCGLSGQVTLNSTGFNDDEWKVMKFSRKEAWGYVGLKASVQVMEWSVFVGRLIGVLLEKPLAILGKQFEKPLGKLKKQYDDLLYSGEKVLSKANDTVEKAKATAQENLDQAKNRAQTGLSKAQEELDKAKAKAQEGMEK
ncbi:MAG: hypothetical protein A2600_03065 [Candidatus Lambdaproteobacteria bacterium RIFOXYD1_FULL_56_27]|uniref:Uncharacterized protein n=1 Tax=Candidatus Lambdaproteobacteria bacterium RIFOXYD2_FULL_56_26 TaxID=1817773 RepID=A0A1F6H330_9PROT|nr:MAG: hypothetical protein A2557_07130 [Candidatus Lambdaproteobacteria bacterium RIFOXYD2_FULL_56_26]OGH05373.1 MAG: hypothetical protein A2426_05455 [Candidatus Lambdaproteobacteria bacterium RIFOXYC1_FULL_56_13]OGH09217.1 MAG: hypothetical protein A2600_03065 [Candidatus Lambdaproteobacteria bacterium RIFOXYD1_FULL_56_27]